MKKLLLIATLALAACGGGGGSSGTSGAAFVQDLLTNTSDTSEPVAIDGLDLRFAESTAAFDTLFQ